ncbi:MAG: Ig-like domain-containing protein [Tannerellaceae bacterium]|jgi:hypothetical protein|nr:Ig-like domain-containing protein [Tannerellaceae bacterium]
MKQIIFILAAVVLSLVLGGCEKDEEKHTPDIISLNISEKTLYYKDEYQIEAASKSAITYTSENEYHAEVSKTGLVTARFVGETNVLLSNIEDNKTFKVIVKPKSSLYPEPDVKFGDTKSSITAKFGTPDSETSSVIGYDNSKGIGYTDYSNTAPILMFLFDEANKLTSYGVMVKVAYLSTLADFLSERYLIVTRSEEDRYWFINGLDTNTAAMAIGLEVYNTSYLRVIYIPNTSGSKSRVLRSDRSSIKTKEFDELLRRLQ